MNTSLNSFVKKKVVTSTELSNSSTSPKAAVYADGTGGQLNQKIMTPSVNLHQGTPANLPRFMNQSSSGGQYQQYVTRPVTTNFGENTVDMMFSSS